MPTANRRREHTMSERNGYEPGVPCWVTVMEPDPPAAGTFYSELLGWEIVPADGHFVGRLRGRDVGGIAPLPPGLAPAPPPAWVTQVSVASADDAAEKATKAGGRVAAGPFDFDLGRTIVIADPAGATFTVWEPRLRKGAQVVNEPGAWSMSRLDTPDPDTAKRFYGELFGWTTETFELGDTSITMFRLPGYVGGEPEQPVSREVVATMAPAEDGPGRWGVDFWVGDVDAATEAGEAAGGRVVVAPFDMPIGRSAVLADPAGVTFSVSRVGG